MSSVINEYIEKREGVCGGKEVVRGHRVPVWEIAEVYNMGADWGELATRFETLSVLELRKAIEYYENNKEIVNRQIEDNQLENLLDSDIPNSHVLNGTS